MYIKLTLFIISISLFSACDRNRSTIKERKMKAEQLFRSVYGGHPNQVDSLVTDNIISSYPIFEQIFAKRVIRGRESYKNFALGFAQRWKDAQITINETIAEDNDVVLVWSFSAKRITTTTDSSFIANQEYSWGGITLFQFDEYGKITREIGEESSPGPFGRIEN